MVHTGKEEAYIYFMDFPVSHSTRDYSFYELKKAFEIWNDVMVIGLIYQHPNHTYGIPFDEELLIDIMLR